MNNDEIIVRQGNNADYKYLAKYGLRFLIRFQNFKFLFNQKNYSLVAFSTLKKKAIGIVYLQKINDDVWGIWSTFIAPDFRGKGIASNLYNKSFEFLRRKDVKKVIGSVSAWNTPSVGNITKIWDGFLDKVNYKLNVPLGSERVPSIEIKKLANNNIQECWDIFSKNMRKEWIGYLEINKENFIDRVYGSAGCEAYSQKMSRKLLVQSELLKVKQNERILGYSAYAKFLIFGKLVNNKFLEYPHLFARNVNDLEVCASSLLKLKGFQVCHYLGDSTGDIELRKSGFKILDKELVCYKNL
jgi:ribosomal protein S18 acetylase RimI-like enzyme